MESHIKAVAILHIVLGGFVVLAGLLVLLFFGGIASLVGMTDAGHDAWIAIPILSGIGTFVFIITLVVSLPGIIAGIGLLSFRPWARILMIVVCALELIQVPLGTVVGIYGLWALLENRSQQLFAALPSRAR